MLAGQMGDVSALGGEQQVQPLDRRRVAVLLLGGEPEFFDIALVAFFDPLLQPVGFGTGERPPLLERGPFGLQFAQLG